MNKTIYLRYLNPGQRMKINGRNYVLSQHEANMTELYDPQNDKMWAFWCWTKVPIQG